MIMGGMWLMVFGGRNYRITMFLTGQFSICASLMIVLFLFVYPSNSPFWLVWITLFVSLGIGLGTGYMA